MKERPILFSDPMVRAILMGQKTQTRRVVNPHPPAQRGILPYLPSAIIDQQDGTFAAYTDGHKAKEFRCPYGQPGDRLWVRERWAMLGNEDGHPVNKAGELCSPREAALIYRADAKVGAYGIHELPDGTNYEGRWTPSIHMPRWACRVVLEIASVRVERLQDISRGDCMEEGCPFPNMAKETDPVGWFRDLWSGINGAESWAANPWVWVVEFRRIQP